MAAPRDFPGRDLKTILKKTSLEFSKKTSGHIVFYNRGSPCVLGHSGPILGWSHHHFNDQRKHIQEASQKCILVMKKGWVHHAPGPPAMGGQAFGRVKQHMKATSFCSTSHTPFLLHWYHFIPLNMHYTDHIIYIYCPYTLNFWIFIDNVTIMSKAKSLTNVLLFFNFVENPVKFYLFIDHFTCDVVYRQCCDAKGQILA